jgi:hypothetical protein
MGKPFFYAYKIDPFCYLFVLFKIEKKIEILLINIFISIYLINKMTTIELKEQMKLLREAQKQAEKAMTKKKKDFELWQSLSRNNRSFVYVNNWKDKYPTFEALIIDNNWKNTYLGRAEFEFIYTGLGFTDEDFFKLFVGWSDEIQQIHIGDRKCGVCLDYYNDIHKRPRKFKNCIHKCCEMCYVQLKKKDGFKCCVICRESEKPK